MKTTVVIPARMASTRFPGKPLALIGGVPMVVRVARQAAHSLADRVLIATDHLDIAHAVRQVGFEAVMTEPDLPSGTDRCLAACRVAGISSGAIINVQGDEPFIHPEQINAVAALIHSGATIGTLVIAIDKATAQDPNKVKTVTDASGRALYFSRAAVPYDRSGDARYLKHLGIYGFDFDTLAQITAPSAGILEKTESLEQLRWLENGHAIHTALTTLESTAVDTPEDLRKIEEMLRSGILKL